MSVAVMFPLAIAVPGSAPYVVQGGVGGIDIPTVECPPGVTMGIGWTGEWDNLQTGMSGEWPRGNHVRETTVIWRRDATPVIILLTSGASTE